jgi:hypothetical protein
MGKLRETLGYILVVNTAVESGYFATPWAYSRGGWLISLLFQVVFIALGYALALQVLEILPKARVLYYLESNGNPQPKFSLFPLLFLGSTSQLKIADIETICKGKEIDMVQVVRLMLGELWCVLYLITLTVYLEGCLITYVNELGRAAAWHWNLSDSEEDVVYRVAVALYLVIAVYYCHIRLKKQMVMQTFMYSARLGLVVFTLFLSLTALFLGEKTYTTPVTSDTRHLSQCISVLTLAGIYQIELPTLLRCIFPMHSLRRNLLFNVSITLLVAYSLTGVLAGITYRYDGEESIGGIRDLKAHHLQHGLVRVFEFFTGVLPALIIVSIFPILLNAMSDNLLAFIYGPNHYDRSIPYLHTAIRLLCLISPFAYCLSSTRLVRAT